MKYKIIDQIVVVLYWIIGFLNWYNGILFSWHENKYANFKCINKSTKWGQNKNYHKLWL